MNIQVKAGMLRCDDDQKRERGIFRLGDSSDSRLRSTLDKDRRLHYELYQVYNVVLYHNVGRGGEVRGGFCFQFMNGDLSTMKS